MADGFMPIRHFGFSANCSEKQTLAQCRKFLKLVRALPEIPKESAKDLLLRSTGIDLSRFLSCHQGTSILIAELLRTKGSSQWDSS
jgi:hypothetical protein